MTQIAKYLKDYQSPAYLVKTVDLIVELGEEFTLVKASLHIVANGHNGTKSLVLDGDELELVSVALNGVMLNAKEYQLTVESLTIPSVSAECQIDTVVKIKPQTNTTLMGLYKSSGNFCTQCEPHGFRRITYYIDRPDNLAIFTVTIVADKAQYPVLLANGNNVDSGDAANGKHWAKWHDPFSKSPHLFALVAGKFDVLDDTFTTMSGRNVKLRLFVEPGNLDKTRHAMDSLKWSMRWDEEAYGREYDLDIFMTVAVGDFNMGAMENKGLNIFNTKFILANPKTATDTDFINVLRVVGHEYFHNWSGNRVGCRDWFQLSLKEGFTVFRDQSFTGDMTSEPVKRIDDVNLLRTMQFREDAGPMSHPIRPASYIEINNFYTLTVYEKGAEVIRMMYTLLGADKFRKATDLYFSRFDGQAVTTDDFVDCMQEAGGIDLTQFRRWYSQSGTPKLTVTDSYDAANRRYSLHVKQVTEPTADQVEKLPLHIPLRMGLLTAAGRELPLKLVSDAAEGDVVRVLNVTEAEQTFEFVNVPEQPTPSLLRSFSAPVKLVYAYSDEQLQLLLKHDSDAFVRWEAGQLFALRRLQTLITDIQAQRPLQLDPALVSMWRHILADRKSDKALVALLLTLPSETYLADQMAKIDPLAIHKAREFVRLSLATELYTELLACYRENQVKQYVFNDEAVGQRALKNVCLSYLMLLNDPAVEKLAADQYYYIDNMTDRLAALQDFASSQSAQRKSILAHFYQQFDSDALVMDKWFTVQALSKRADTFEQVQALMHNPRFDLKNPNKVRALIAAFARMNPGQFHAHDGKPYKFLADIVIELDKINPQIASRLVEPLTHWKRYAEPHQKQMHAELSRINKEKLSPDTFEVVSKALA